MFAESLAVRAWGYGNGLLVGVRGCWAGGSAAFVVEGCGPAHGGERFGGSGGKFNACLRFTF